MPQRIELCSERAWGMGELQGGIDDPPPLNDAFTEATLAEQESSLVGSLLSLVRTAIP